jgi:hypothetical protein
MQGAVASVRVLRTRRAAGAGTPWAEALSARARAVSPCRRVSSHCTRHCGATATWRRVGGNRMSAQEARVDVFDAALTRESIGFPSYSAMNGRTVSAAASQSHPFVLRVPSAPLSLRWARVKGKEQAYALLPCCRLAEHSLLPVTSDRGFGCFNAVLRSARLLTHRSHRMDQAASRL